MSFKLDLQAFVDKFQANADLVVRKITIDCANSMIQMAPVDTGRFRSNFNFAVGAPNTITSESVDKDGSATLTRITSQANQTGAGQVTYITNSLPYAEKLEIGSSRQAPAGYARITAIRFQEFVNNAVAEVPK